MKLTQYLYLGCAPLLLSLSVWAAIPGDALKGQPIAQQVCASCHGVDGNSAVAANPVLAGQSAEYLYKQLVQFKAPLDPKRPESARKSPVMRPQVAHLSDADFRNLAAYYSQQKRKLRKGVGEEAVKRGEKIYRGGIASKQVAACMSCHGPSGNGIPPQYPQVAGQHADYIVAEMKAFRAMTRTNDPSQMMQRIAAKLSDPEIDAVAQYMAGLRARMAGL